MTPRIWRIQDGLSDPFIQSIAQTSDHYIWLGTPRGLQRFDGFHFVDYGTDLAPALREFGVYCLLASRDGSLWVGTAGGGVIHFNSGRAQTYSSKEGLQTQFIRALEEDSSGQIWAGTDHGLYRLQKDRFVRVEHITPANPSVQSIIQDGKGGLWLGGHRLIHYANQIFEDIPLPDQGSSTRIRALRMDSSGTLWIGTANGLLKLKTAGRVEAEPKVPESVRALYGDSQQRLWIGTIGGGLLLRNRSHTFSRFTLPPSLVNNTALAMTQSIGSDLWIGTPSGLVRLGRTGIHLKQIPGSSDADFGSLAVDTDDSIWVCSGKLIHLRSDQVIHAHHPPLHGVAVRSVLREQSGAFWIGTMGRGAYRFSRNGEIQRFAAAIGTSYINGFLQTSEDTVWIASDAGVARWHRGILTSYQSAPKAPHEQVLAMADAGGDGLWIGTSHGLFLLRDGRFITNPASSALGTHRVWALRSSHDGTLWIGTESGLFGWRGSHLIHFFFRNEGSSTAVLSILEDHHERLWLGNPTAVLRIRLEALERIADEEQIAPERVIQDVHVPVDPEIFFVSQATGAVLYGGVSEVAQLDHSGGAWFATNEGPLHIDAAEIPHQDDVPKIVVDKIVVDGRQVSFKEPVLLQPSDKTLEIETTPILLGPRTGLQIKRRLFGFDTAWTPLPYSHTSTYNNLRPGHYTYRVEAKWPDSPKTSFIDVDVVQRAHFYKHPAFLWFSIALLLLLVWLYYRFRIYRMTLRFQTISEERNRVAREMHDTLLQGCIGVSTLLEGVASKQTQTLKNHSSIALDDAAEGWRPTLDLAREQIEKTIIEARDAIWDLRHLHEGTDLRQVLQTLFLRMTSSTGVTATFSAFGLPKSIGHKSIRDLVMTVREALHNAVHHAHPQHISLELNYLEDKISITILDDGQGFIPDQNARESARHFGLIGMHERMMRIRGTCHIDSIPGTGTAVRLTLPIRIENQRNSHP